MYHRTSIYLAHFSYQFFMIDKMTYSDTRIRTNRHIRPFVDTATFFAKKGVSRKKEGSSFMEPHLRIWRLFRQQRLASHTRHFVCLALAVVFLGGCLGQQAWRPNTSRTSTVMSGETPGHLTNDFSPTMLSLIESQKIALAKHNLPHERLSLRVKPTNTSPSAPVNGGGHPAPNQGSGHPAPGQGSGNVFPYGTCTWWADQRYYQLHGSYVPWRTQANAWQWTARARQFNWRVSSQPSPGAIIVLQPGVQGSYGMGHVAVVEKILSNGHVIASNMSWGGSFGRVTDVEFAPGPGVSFISAN
jgi:surface antigen